MSSPNDVYVGPMTVKTMLGILAAHIAALEAAQPPDALTEHNLMVALVASERKVGEQAKRIADRNATIKRLEDKLKYSWCQICGGELDSAQATKQPENEPVNIAGQEQGKMCPACEGTGKPLGIRSPLIYCKPCNGTGLVDQPPPDKLAKAAAVCKALDRYTTITHVSWDEVLAALDEWRKL